MANKVKIRKMQRKAPKRKSGPGFQERLKKLSDNAPVVELRGGSFAFYSDEEAVKFKDN